jgi:Domain of unknown function (DUF1833)
MSRSMSTLFKTMANASETGEVLLALVTIDSPSIVGGPLRVVQDLQNITSNGNVYSAFPFEIRLANDDDQGPAKITLTLDNIDRTMAAAIKGIPPQDPPSVTVEIVVASAPNTVEITMSGLTLKNVTGDAFRIDGELWMDEEDLLPFPEGSFTPTYFPGLFK